MITSESPSVSAEERAFSNRTSPADWQKMQFNFLHNNFDVQQNTGLMVRNGVGRNDLDKVMISSLSSLRAQLSNKLLLLNCCSNFHFLMHMFVTAGCGRRWDAEAVCLREHPEEEFRLCCQWTKTERCKALQAGKEGNKRKRGKKQKK